ncbi:hypothetical protein AGATL06_10890 [Agathobaculum sp. TL06]
MDKRKMLSFDETTRMVIEAAASLFLFFCAYKLLGGAGEAGQEPKGTGIMLFFSVVFAVGGLAGLIKTFIKYKRYRKDHPAKRQG